MTQLMQRWQQTSQYLADWRDSLLAAELRCSNGSCTELAGVVIANIAGVVVCSAKPAAVWHGSGL